MVKKITYIILTLSVIVIFASLCRIFVADTFRVKGHSMEPCLYAGDRIVAEKLTMGPRIYKKFNFSSSSLSCFRLPGLGHIHPGDIVVFNSPEGGGKGRIGFKINYVYAKRCIGTPGDTISIIKGFYHNSSTPGRLICSPEMQSKLSERPDSLYLNYGECMSGTPWTLKNYGPLPIPRKGQTILLDSILASTYERAIEYETGEKPECGKPYTFKGDWFFFGGDNVVNSRDSRFFGIVPSDYIIGKVLPLGHKDRTARGLMKNDHKLEQSLVFAGENRGELERVLCHYSKEKEKTDAAQWLIKNMPAHFSYANSAKVDSTKAFLADIYTGKKVSKDRIARFRDSDYENLSKIYDSNVITADFLIDNIEKAFEARDKRPWNKNLPFEDFCEFLLPYRAGTEPLEYWRDVFCDRYSYILDSLYRGTDPIEAVNIISEELDNLQFKYFVDFKTPSHGHTFLMKYKIGTCREICEYVTYLMRALGVPVGTDFSNKGFIHSWNVVRDTTGKTEVFWFDHAAGQHVSRGANDGRTKGKVWRNTFEPRGGLLYKDVSADYFGGNSCSVPLSAKVPEKICLGLGERGSWIPISWGETRRGRSATFKDIEPDLAYAPVDKKGRIQGYPFTVSTSGVCHQFIPAKDDVRQIRVCRKALLKDRIIHFMDESEGIIIEGSEYLDFKHIVWRDTLKRPDINYNWIYPEKTMRFLRLRSSDSKCLQLAEITAFRDSHRKDTIRTQIASCSEQNNKSLSNLIDGDVLTYFRSKDSQASVILDMGSSETVRSIEWVPRNDDNFIRFGDRYELLFSDGISGWKKIGEQEARDTVLFYENVPDNALLRLHDKSRGKEEDAFIFQDGRQVFMTW